MDKVAGNTFLIILFFFVYMRLFIEDDEKPLFPSKICPAFNWNTSDVIINHNYKNIEEKI